MNVLVTGCGGFIGFHVTKRLLNEGHTVYGVDNYWSAFGSIKEQTNENLINSKVFKNIELLKEYPNFKFAPIDVIDLQLIQEKTNYFKNIDVVIHLAAAPRVQYSFDYLRDSSFNNLMPITGVLDFMIKNNVKSIVFASSSTAKTCLSPYGLHKKFNEDLLLMYRECFDIEPVILRYHSVYGPGMDADSKYALLVPRAIKAAYSGEEFPLYGDGSVERDFTYIDDVVEATIRSFTVFKGGSDIRFDVGAASPVSVSRILEIIEEKTGKKINVKQLPSRVEPQQTIADTQNMETFFSFKPNITIEEGISKMIEDDKQ